MNEFLVNNVSLMTKLLRREMMCYLENGMVDVVFEKSDGSIRNMLCTLVPQLIPFDNAVEIVYNEEQENSTTIRVFEVSIQAWRSFRVSRVISFR